MAIVTKTRTYSTSDSLPATYYNQDRDEIIAGVNSIDNAQISNGAAIVEQKLSFNDGGHGHTGGADGKKLVGYTTNQHRGYGFYVTGTPLVTGTNLSWNPTVPQNNTAEKLWAKVKTAPGGQPLVLQISVVGGAVVGSLTIPTGQTAANTTTFTTPALAAGVALQLDITQVGTGPAGDDLSVILECTEP